MMGQVKEEVPAKICFSHSAMSRLSRLHAPPIDVVLKAGPLGDPSLIGLGP
jgi:hypothetical protein